MSTEEQAARGACLAGQLAACRDHCDQRDLIVAGEWTDTLSGRDPERPGYRAMLAGSATYDCIVVWRLDRLGRDEAEFFAAYAALTRAVVQPERVLITWLGVGLLLPPIEIPLPLPVRAHPPPGAPLF